MDNLVFLDCETTGFKEPRMIQLAYKHQGKTFNKMFNPQRDIDYDAMAVHHVTNKMVADEPAFEGSQDKTDLYELLKDNVAVIHNAVFDIKILQIEGVPVRKYICTYKCAKKLLEAQGYGGRHKLWVLRYALKLDIKEEATAHDALGDVIVLEALFEYLIKLAKGETREERIAYMIKLSY